MANYTDRYYRNLYRQQNAPHTSLAAAGFTPAAFNPMVYEAPANDISILQNSLRNLDTRKEKTDQQRANIQTALAAIDLNEADSEWKQSFIDDILGKIDSAAQYGDYSSALEVATTLGATAASNPELLGRAKANQQYQAWRKDIDDRATSGKIDRRTADRLIEENPYSFKAITDSNGNIVGGSNWVDTGGKDGGSVDKAVNKISLESIFQAVDSIVAEHSSSGAGYSARDDSGKPTGLYGDDATFYTKSSGSVRQKSLSTLQTVFDELVSQHPEIGAYLEQMKKDDAWEINKLEQEIAANPNASDTYSKQETVKALKQRLYTPNGLSIVSTADYLDKMSKGSIKAMAYRNTTSDVSMSGGKEKKNPNEPTDPSGNPAPTHTNFTGKTLIQNDGQGYKVTPLSQIGTSIDSYIDNQ